jgi:VanZ family protein
MKLRRLWWAVGVVLVAAALVVCLLPVRELPQSFNLNDKLSHLLGHAALAVYFAGLVPRSSWWKIFVFLLLFGVVVEFAQYNLPLGRQGEVLDLVANASGAALGLLLARLGLARWPEIADQWLGRAAP